MEEEEEGPGGGGVPVQCRLTLKRDPLLEKNPCLKDAPHYHPHLGKKEMFWRREEDV